MLATDSGVENQSVIVDRLATVDSSLATMREFLPLRTTASLWFYSRISTFDVIAMDGT
jgi:hypothetical protein